jgi:hypothetical protein
MGFENELMINPEGGEYEGFSWGEGTGDTGEYADELGDTGDTGLEEASSMAAGSVAGYSAGGKKKKSLIREEEPIIEEVLNYLLGKMEIL